MTVWFLPDQKFKPPALMHKEQVETKSKRLGIYCPKIIDAIMSIIVIVL